MSLETLVQTRDAAMAACGLDVWNFFGDLVNGPEWRTRQAAFNPIYTEVARVA